MIRRIGRERSNWRVSLPSSSAEAHGIGPGIPLTLLAEIAGAEQSFASRTVARAGGLYVTIPHPVRRVWGVTHGDQVWLLLGASRAVTLQPVKGASPKELERLRLSEALDCMEHERRRAEAYLAALQTRGAAALRSWEAGQGIRRSALARLARENRALQEEVERLRRLLCGHQESEGASAGASGGVARARAPE